MTLLPPKISNAYFPNVPTRNLKTPTAILTIPTILLPWIGLAIRLLCLLGKRFASFGTTSQTSRALSGNLWKMMSSGKLISSINLCSSKPTVRTEGKLYLLRCMVSIPETWAYTHYWLTFSRRCESGTYQTMYWPHQTVIFWWLLVVCGLRKNLSSWKPKGQVYQFYPYKFHLCLSQYVVGEGRYQSQHQYIVLFGSVYRFYP